MTKESIVSMLMQMMNATKKDSKGNESPDWPARNNAIVVFSRLTGDLDKRVEVKKEENPQEEKSLFKDLSKLSGQQLIEARKDILDKMVLQ